MAEHTGNESLTVEEMILKEIQDGPVINDNLCQLLKANHGTGRATYYRAKNRLLESGEIVNIRKKGKQWVGLPGSDVVVLRPPSAVDDLLLRECERLASDILASGLANPKPDPNDASAKPEEALLLRRCITLHSSLQWLNPRRRATLPVRWPVPRNREDDPRKWDRNQKAWYRGEVEMWTSPREGQLHGWLVYYLNVIDLLAREKMRNENKTKE